MYSYWSPVFLSIPQIFQHNRIILQFSLAVAFIYDDGGVYRQFGTCLYTEHGCSSDPPPIWLGLDLSSLPILLKP